MSKHKFTPEFREEAVKQVTKRGYSVKEVSKRLGVSTHSLYAWIKNSKPVTEQDGDLAATRLENQKLKAELRRVQEERDILKKAAAFFARDPK